MRVIVIFGPQGAGKGTQSKFIVQRYGIPHFSPGALFRAEMEKGTELGKQVGVYVSKGEIVPTELAERIIGDRLSQPDTAEGVVLDGYPRIREQADQLERILKELGRHVTHAVYLNISDQTALERLSGRLECTNRACGHNFHVKYKIPKVPGICDYCGSPIARRHDDEPEAIKRRLEIFHRETEPLAELYRAEGVLHVVDAEGGIDDTTKAVAAILDKG